MDLKKILKFIKLHEQRISVVAGIIILIIAGLFTVKYIKNLRETNTPAATPIEIQNQTHVVTKGETLWSISQKYYNKGEDWKKIADANKISNVQKLEIGTNLIIPDTAPTPSPKPTGQISEKAASTTSEITSSTYTVVKGDNLWKIAMRAYGNGTKWVDIAKANHLVHPNLIHSGNVFTIPR